MRILTEQKSNCAQRRERMYVGKVQFCRRTCSDARADVFFKVVQSSVSDLQQGMQIFRA
jgi:hypothetical protein